MKKRIGLLRRIRKRIPRNKLVIISEAIFNSKIRYVCAVYLKPTFEEEELKMKKLSKNVSVLQTLQNKMIRVIFGVNKQKHINVESARKKLKMMSVNQLCVYHTLIETYNIMKKSASEQLQGKWSDLREKKYSLRSVASNDLKIPERPTKSCIGFSYTGAKLYNMLPMNIRESLNPTTFKSLTKKWIWEKIPY